MTTKRLAILNSLLLLLPLMLATSLVAQGKRPLNSDDVYNLKEVRDPQVSPEGKWVAYTVTRAIKETDKNDTDVWMVSWDGQQQIQVTSTPESESSPRWSPDGTYLAFLSSRQGSKGAQIWLLNRAGGEAVKVGRACGFEVEPICFALAALFATALVVELWRLASSVLARLVPQGNLK